MDFEDEHWMDFMDPENSGRTEGKDAFVAVWRDHFWGHEIDGFTYAMTMEDAIEQVRGHEAEGLPIHSLRRDEEYVEGLSGGYTVRAARILIEADDVLVEETIPALTASMAVDLARDMFEPHCRVIALQEGGESMVLVDREMFRDGADIPLGWEQVLKR
jgi:hypothetical protein